VYDFQDALLVGSMLITLLRHADRVKIACMAQLVNVIAPIMTSDTGAWRQTIFYPYLLTAKHGTGVVLQTLVKGPSYDNEKFGQVPCIDAVAVYNGEKEELVLFAVNKNLEQDIPITMELRQFAEFGIAEHKILHDEDLYAVNTQENPDRILPRNSTESAIYDGVLTVNLKHKSWNMIRLTRLG
jgi:alpha-N-arabinofuranosidase